MNFKQITVTVLFWSHKIDVIICGGNVGEQDVEKQIEHELWEADLTKCYLMLMHIFSGATEEDGKHVL